jgi:hypothetical protein
VILKRTVALLSGTAVFAALAVAVAVAAGPPSKAETEPNNTPGTANFLNPAGCYTAGSGNVSPGADVDTWSFPAQAGHLVWASIDTGGTQNAGATSRDTVMDLLDTNGATVIENDDDDGTGNGGDGTIETGLASEIAGRQLPKDGTDFLRLNAFSPTGIIDPYRIFLASTAETPVNEVEPNDSVGQANPILNCRVPVDGTITEGDADSYSVFLRNGETMFFSADGDPDRDGVGTDMVVEVHQPGGALALSVDSSITGSLANPAAEGADFTATTTGTYTVRVRHFSATGTGTYRLLVAGEDEPPTTTIDSGPEGTISTGTPTFSFSGADDITPKAGIGFECSLRPQGQPAAFHPCGGGFGPAPVSTSVLTDGSYALAIRAKDGAGFVDSTPAQRSFSVSLPKPPSSGAAKLGSLPKSVQIDAAGKGTASVKCENVAADICKVSLSLQLQAKKAKSSKKGKPLTLGTATGTISGGQTGALSFVLSKKGIARLKQAGQLKVQAVGSSQNRGGAATAVASAVTLKAKAKKK